MTTTLLLIRHGLTDWNVSAKWQGHTDIPLNDVGHQQAEKLAQRLAHWPIRAIISSDLQRCKQTAVALAAPHQLQPIWDAAWRERDVGDFAGHTTEEVRRLHPDIWAKSRNGLIDPPNGEPFVQLRQRAITAYRQAVAAYPQQTVAIVSHGGIIHVLIREIIGIDPAQYGRFSLRGNTGLSIVEVTQYGAYLTRLNDTAHLDP